MSEEAVTRSQGGGVQDGSAGNLVGAASGEIYGIGCRIPPPHPETAGEISVAGGGACRPPTRREWRRWCRADVAVLLSTIRSVVVSSPARR